MKWEFAFGRKHGAVLILIKPVTTKFSMDGNLRPLLKLIDEELDGKALVTTIVTCPAYALTVSCGRDQSATIGVAGASSIPTTPLTAGAGAEISWVHSSTAGAWKVGSQQGCSYTPMFELSVLKQWWRRWSKEAATLRDSWELEDNATPFAPHLPPWAPLDEEGEEVLVR